MRPKKILFVTLFVFVFALWPVSIAQACQPPLPPEITILVCDVRYSSNTEPIFDQFTTDAAKCGIRLNVNVVGYMDAIMSLYMNEYDIIMFITIAWYQPDSLDTVLWLLDYYFGEFNLWNYQNEVIQSKIQLMKDYYYNGFETEAISVFQEIEMLIYEGQSHPALGYHFDSSLIHTHQLIVNSHPDRPGKDLAIRKALSFLIDRELYVTALELECGYTITQTSHLFGWSQYHDSSLPEITHSIGKAASTLAKAGYRPRALH